MFVLRKVKALYFRCLKDSSPIYSPAVQTRQCEEDVPTKYIRFSVPEMKVLSTEDLKLSVPQEFLQRRVFIISALLSSPGERNLSTVRMNIATTGATTLSVGSICSYSHYLFSLLDGAGADVITFQVNILTFQTFPQILHRNLC